MPIQVRRDTLRDMFAVASDKEQRIQADLQQVDEEIRQYGDDVPPKLIRKKETLESFLMDH